METDISIDVAPPWSGWKLTKMKASPKSAVERRQCDRAGKRLCLELGALAVVRQIDQALYEGKDGIVLSEADSLSLIEKATKSLSGHDLRHTHNFLVGGLVRGRKQLGWVCEPPAYMHVAQPAKSYFSQDEAKERDLARQIRSTFFDALPRSFEQPEEALMFDAGQLLVSLVLNGRLMNTKWLEAFPKALKEGLLRHGSYRWFDLQIDVPEDEPLIRRFFPDSLSLLLIRRWYSRYGNVWPTKGHQVLLSYYFQKSGSPGLKGTKLSRLISAAVSDAAFELAPFLVHYASSYYVCSSLTQDNWMRFLTGRLSARQFDRADDDEYQSNAICSINDSLYEIDIQHEEEWAMLADLKSLLVHRPNGQFSKVRLRQSLTELVERQQGERFCTLFVRWILDNFKAWKPATMRRYIQCIGKPILTYLDLCPFDDLENSDAWSGFYEEVIAGQSPSKKETRRRENLLARFHRYLIRFYGAPPVELSQRSVRSAVNAGFITPREYSRAVNILINGANDRAINLSRTLVLVIGYRCGLRRSEAMGLLLGDLSGVGDPRIDRPELIVRLNRYRDLKSNMGMRRLPIWALLTAQEMRWLAEWKQDREGQFYGSANKKLLLELNSNRLTADADENLFKPVTRALIRATGDESIRFHDLRHSFANITFMRMLEETPGAFWAEEFSLDDEGQRQIPFADRRFSEVLNLVEPGEITSKTLWVLSTFCGHVDTKTTLASYVHFLDLILYKSIETFSPVLTIEQQAALLDLKTTSLQVKRTRSGIKGACTAVALLEQFGQTWPRSCVQSLELHIPAHRDRPFRLNVTACSGRS